MINFDLHIHSYASKYKEADGIVDNSNIGNAEVLMDALDKYHVGLFSITDHNRFWPELYERFNELIEEGKYPYVQGIVAGVEFDVQIDPKMGKCHILTYFDTDNNPEKYRRIHVAISEDEKEKKDAYSKEEFENLLSKIGLDVILIACQRSGLDKHDGKNANSLSDSTMKSEELISVGYISALEYQKPKVEGILQNSLKILPHNVALVTGSDCHEWSCYPKHDHSKKDNSFRHSKANILPTFKGLLMAVTSPETRINQPQNKNTDYIHSISINGKEYPLVNGINAIIGENGSGKSTLLKIMVGETKEKFVKDLRDKNNIFSSNTLSDKCLFIKQGEIVSQFERNELIKDDYYESIDHIKFKQIYTQYANDLLSAIRNKIAAKEARDKLFQIHFTYDDIINSGLYFVGVDYDDHYSEVANPHSRHNKELSDIIEKLNAMKSDCYYSSFTKEIDDAIQALLNIYTKVHADNERVKLEKNVKNDIVSALKQYDEVIRREASSIEQEHRNYVERRTSFISDIAEASKKNAELMKFPKKPVIVEGHSSSAFLGFEFNSEAAYDGKDVFETFLNKMFIKSYADPDALKDIDTDEEIVEAIRGCSDESKIDQIYKQNLASFIDEMCTCQHYIVDTSLGVSHTLGNTLGEMSLAYFKYVTAVNSEETIFLIDQPEDHISNNNISKKLLQYFNSIRSKKQVILVTHNPLLVVNQDVDQVMYLKKDNDDKIHVIAGPLEYEDKSKKISILNVVADNMDGGREAIAKRLKVYGKENRTDNASI